MDERKVVHQKLTTNTMTSVSFEGVRSSRAAWSKEIGGTKEPPSPPPPALPLRLSFTSAATATAASTTPRGRDQGLRVSRHVFFRHHEGNVFSSQKKKGKRRKKPWKKRRQAETKRKNNSNEKSALYTMKIVSPSV